MIAKKAAWKNADIVASTTFDTTNPPVLVTAMSHTVTKTCWDFSGSHDPIARRSRGPSAEK
ncbi:unannotated protein [freshwater metagenome]|uniref:Unannotated protein n=1 Tax=freshwater metagenome TaxID=449393 RepID=A0A6J7C2Z4_9ZZZZ